MKPNMLEFPAMLLSYLVKYFFILTDFTLMKVTQEEKLDKIRTCFIVK